MACVTYLCRAPNRCPVPWVCSGHFEICLVADSRLVHPTQPWGDNPGILNQILKTRPEAGKVRRKAACECGLDSFWQQPLRASTREPWLSRNSACVCARSVDVGGVMCPRWCPSLSGITSSYRAAAHVRSGHITPIVCASCTPRLERVTSVIVWVNVIFILRLLNYTTQWSHGGMVLVN